MFSYSGLNLNQDKAASRRQYTRYGKASQRCTGLNLIHYIMPPEHLSELSNQGTGCFCLLESTLRRLLNQPAL